jgi:hypothetical protein
MELCVGPFTRERIENWVGDFCASDALRLFAPGTQEFASVILAEFMIGACAARDVEPDDLEEADLKAALLTRVARLELPAGARQEAPGLCGAFLSDLEQQGRLAGGRALAAYVRALKPAHEEAASGKPKPIQRAGSPIGRNDPCPCGSGKKYKKCCLGQ